MQEDGRVGREKTLQFAYFGDKRVLCTSDEMVSLLPKGANIHTKQCLADN